MGASQVPIPQSPLRPTDPFEYDGDEGEVSV